MDTSIFGKPLDVLEFQDIVDFCDEQIEENLNLDYKKDLSSVIKVVKTAVSFANSNGGWIVVGVEDEDDKPKLPVEGMDHATNHVQKITNCIIDTISPVFKIQTRVVLSEDETKSFLVVYAPQSNDAPHWMRYRNDNMLFVRVGDRSDGATWEQTASTHQLEMMQNKRAKSIEFRAQIAYEMQSIFEAKAKLVDDEEFNRANPPYISNGFTSFPNPNRAMRFTLPGDLQHTNGSIIVRISPTFPSEEITDVATLKQRIANNPISNGFNNVHSQTPDVLGNSVAIFQRGAYVHYKDHIIDGHYFYGTDIYGGILHIVPVEQSRSGVDGGPDVHFVEVREILTAIEGTLRVASKQYEELGLSGNIVVEVNFVTFHAPLRLLTSGFSSWPYPRTNFPTNITGEFSIKYETTTFVLADESTRASVVHEMADEIFKSFNYDLYSKEQLTDAIQSASSPRIAR